RSRVCSAGSSIYCQTFGCPSSVQAHDAQRHSGYVPHHSEELCATLRAAREKTIEIELERKAKTNRRCTKIASKVPSRRMSGLYDASFRLTRDRHSNGRPLFGRSSNRTKYSYVVNNPVTETDPTGFA